MNSSFMCLVNSLFVQGAHSERHAWLTVRVIEHRAAEWKECRMKDNMTSAWHSSKRKMHFGMLDVVLRLGINSNI